MFSISVCDHIVHSLKMKGFVSYIDKLRVSGLRATKQRLMICKMLFGQKKTFHFTIENLNKLLKKNFNAKISLATLYNTIHAFKKKGYLKEIALKGNKTYFDTNTSNHHHFYDENTEELIDITDSAISVSNIPNAPNNKSIAGIELMVKLANDYHNQK